MTDWQKEIEAIYPAILLGLGTLVSLFFVIRAIARGGGKRGERRLVVEEAPPLCECGEPATLPLPHLEWSRVGFGAWLRKVYGAPPRLVRKVDNMRRPEVCEAHAPMADVALDQFVFDKRKQYADLNHVVVTDVVRFEREGLRAKIVESLTEAQKKRKRESERSNVTRLVRNGTEDAPS